MKLRLVGRDLFVCSDLGDYMRYQIAILSGMLLIAGATFFANDPAHADVPATQPATTNASPPSITWDEASKHIGETVTVTGPVLGTHITAGGKALILNVGKDYPDPMRFSVMVNIDEKDKASEETYKGKTITVTGKIEMYRKTPEIKSNLDAVIIQK